MLLISPISVKLATRKVTTSTWKLMKTETKWGYYDRRELSKTMLCIAAVKYCQHWMITPLQIQIYSSASILEVTIVSSPNNNVNINSDGDGNAGRHVCRSFHRVVEVFITGGLPRASPVFENPILEIGSSTDRRPSSEALSRANNSSSYMYICLVHPSRICSA